MLDVIKLITRNIIRPDTPNKHILPGEHYEYTSDLVRLFTELALVKMELAHELRWNEYIMMCDMNYCNIGNHIKGVGY